MNATYTIGQEISHPEHGTGTITYIGRDGRTFDAMFNGGEESGLFIEDIGTEATPKAVELKMTVREAVYAIENGLTRYKGDASRERALDMVDEVAMKSQGFAADVAKTVLKFEKVSSKQATVIAEAFVKL